MHPKISKDLQIAGFVENYIKHQIIRKLMMEKFTILVEQGEDGYLISEVIELLGCHTQAKTYDELLKRTKEAISLY